MRSMGLSRRKEVRRGRLKTGMPRLSHPPLPFADEIAFYLPPVGFLSCAKPSFKPFGVHILVHV